MKRFFLLAVLLVSFGNVSAKEICFVFTLESGGENETASIQQRAEFLSVNGKGIPFVTVFKDELPDYIRFTKNRGCINSEYIFDRPNELSFSIETGDRSKAQEQMTVVLFVENARKELKKLFTHVWHKGHVGSNFSVIKSFTLEQLDPEGARQKRMDDLREKERREREDLEKFKHDSEAERKKDEEAHKKELAERQAEVDKQVNEGKADLDEFRNETSELQNEGKEISDQLVKDMLGPDEPASVEDALAGRVVPDVHCFTGDTEVMVAEQDSDDFKLQRIDQVKVGSLVWSCDLTGETCVQQTVVSVFSHDVDQTVEIRVNGITLTTTPDHLFHRWNDDAEESPWVEAKKLQVGDQLTTKDGSEVFVERIKRKNSKVKVYNVGVESKVKSFNYYVTKLGILVHNCGNEPGADLPFVNLGTGAIQEGGEALGLAAELGVDVATLMATFTPGTIPTTVLKMGKGAVKRYIRGMLKDKVKSTGRTPIPSKRNVYSTLYEMRLKTSSYPGSSRAKHFQEANEHLLKQMEKDSGFKRLIESMGVKLERTQTGLAPRKPPEGFTWHHERESGLMRLVPRSQHSPGSSYWKILHPDGKGGWAIWGK